MNPQILTVIIVMLSLITSIILALVYTYFGATKLPNNNPSKYLKRKIPSKKSKRNIVLIGDSITHGRVGKNYVELLAERLDDEQFELINAGINSELAYNVLQRLDDIINCKPDIVTILIGTNDANGSFTPKNQKFYTKRMKLPQYPTSEWYEENLKSIITQLQLETKAQIAVLSLPTIGEISNHPAFMQSIKYSKIIQNVARKTGACYLALNERMASYLKEHPTNPKYPYEKHRLEMYKAIARYYLFRESWDQIAANKGFNLHIDYLHLNSVGAMMVVDLIEQFVIYGKAD
ncbi:MAG: SGNH/GDSL hydrolase family protein [Candidatus Hermodarchaeota archaeon]